MSKKILVVDDDGMSLKMADFILGDTDYEVKKAQSGMECLDILSKETVDLILLDIEMPKMNGIETLKQIKAVEGLAKIPVMMLTGSIDAESVKEAEHLGAAASIEKPFIPQDLLERVEKILS